jgi:hypothetical protein
MRSTIIALAFASMILLSGTDQAVSAGAIAPDITKGTTTDVLTSQLSSTTRTNEDIQSVFDRNQPRLYEAYQRYLTKQPALQGGVELRITIEPNGVVSKCRVESSDIQSKALLVDIVNDIKQFDFGAKENVPRTTIIYPINFVPASSEKNGM